MNWTYCHCSYYRKRMTAVYVRLGAQGKDRVHIGFYCSHCKSFVPNEGVRLKARDGREIEYSDWSTLKNEVSTRGPECTLLSSGVHTVDQPKETTQNCETCGHKRWKHQGKVLARRCQECGPPNYSQWRPGGKLL